MFSVDDNDVIDVKLVIKYINIDVLKVGKRVI